ncbi:hypothetical protein KP509_13G075100 [Ceratopteris richardii]|uniref:Uncharacterized protein n=1 Tax=Ceratopteris richardii TaxID=49495 RepID=A0A8T2TMG5_CERRI|nr:hypothetical protein KP509_13G075100 [Ceratopteris richardii]
MRKQLLLPFMGVVKIVLTIVDGSSFTLSDASDALFVRGIKKNLLSVSALAKIGLVVKFVDDRCTIHDLSNGASGILCRWLYKLIDYGRSVNDSAGYVRCKALACTLWSSEFC